MSIIVEDSGQISSESQPGTITSEYFQYDRYRSHRDFRNRMRYFGWEISATLDAEIIRAVEWMDVVQNESRLLQYLKSTPPDQIPLELRLFFQQCVSYYRSSNFCDAMVDNTERDIRNNDIVLVQDAQDIVYLFKYWEKSDKIVVCVSDDGSVGLFDDWTMNLLLKYCWDPSYEWLGEIVGSRRKLKFKLAPRFSIVRIQWQVKHTCFKEVLKDLREELQIPFRQRNRFSEEIQSI